MANPILKKILRYKNRTVLLSVGTLFPENWKYVLITKQKKGKNIIILTFEKMTLEKLDVS